MRGRRPIPGFARYTISPAGTIWGRDGTRLRPYRNDEGYPKIALVNDEGRRVRVLVHRLVLTTFVGPCPEGCEALHGLGGRHDCRLANLSWGTRQANRAEIDPATRRSRPAKALGDRARARIREADDSLRRLARRTGVHPRTLRRIRQEDPA